MEDADTTSIGIQFPTARHVERTAQVHRLTRARLMFTFRPVAFAHGVERKRKRTMMPNQSAAANRRPAGQLDGSGNLFATVAAARAFPAAVAELGRSTRDQITWPYQYCSHYSFLSWLWRRV